jgi:predicted membrane channel-forming protein YqfA (hemolysin III family)
MGKKLPQQSDDVLQGRSMMKWDYDKEEILVDGIVHALGLILGLVSVVVLLVIAA